jgi:hypothetical protein
MQRISLHESALELIRYALIVRLLSTNLPVLVVKDVQGLQCSCNRPQIVTDKTVTTVATIKYLSTMDRARTTVAGKRTQSGPR